MLPGDEKIMPYINIWMEKKIPGDLKRKTAPGENTIALCIVYKYVPPGKSAQRSVVSAVN